MKFTISEIIRICDGNLCSGSDTGQIISSVATNLTYVEPGCLYTALPGEKSDGHEEILTAFEQGAVCALADRGSWENCGGPVIMVPCVLTAVQKIAAAYRQQFDIPVVGIIGSLGKTSTRQMISSVLAEKYIIHKTEANHNGLLGVTMTLLSLCKEHQIAVVEMGINTIGDMETLARMVRPDVLVFTSVGSAHLEGLIDVEGILREKMKATAYVPKNGLLVFNGDDTYLREVSTTHRRIDFGCNEACGVQAVSVTYPSSEMTVCEVKSRNTVRTFRIPFYGEHMVSVMLAAVTVGREFGLTDAQIQEGICKYDPPAGRSRLHKGKRFTVIHDYYNANPDSVKSALCSMRHLSGRRVFILGQMQELGKQSEVLHRQIGEIAAQSGISLLLCCGRKTKPAATAAGEIGYYFETKEQLSNRLPELLRDGDVICIKASRSEHFEILAREVERFDVCSVGHLQEEAVLLYDCEKERPVYQENPHMQLPIHSITKIMTALVVIEEVPNPEKTVLTIQPECVEGIEANITSLSGFELHINEHYTVLNLLYGCIVSSGCEAAQQLALYVGKGSISCFMALVNKKLLRLGCLETHFINPIGHSDENCSSAADICTILQYAMRNPLFRRIASTAFCRFEGFPEANWSTNKLINPRYWQNTFFPYAVGGKTGSAPVSGGSRKCLACLFERAGREYIGIILNSYAPKTKVSDFFAHAEPLYYRMISLLEQEFAKKTYMRIQFSSHYISAKVGSEFTLEAKLSFTNCKEPPIYKWYSTDKTVADVNAEGVVTVMSSGLTQIIVMTQTGDYDFCQLNSTGCDEITMHRPNMSLFS